MIPKNQTAELLPPATCCSGFAQLEVSLSNRRLNDYDEIAPAFNDAMGNDFADVIFEPTRQLIERTVTTSGRLRHLDIACGTGVLLLKLAKAIATEPTGIDISKGQIRQAKLGARKKGVQARFVVGDIVTTPFPDGYDVVTCNMDALNHIHNLRDWERVFSKVRGCLRSGGLFLFDVNTVQRLISDFAYPGIIVKPHLTYLHYALGVGREGKAVRRKMLMQVFLRSGDGYKKSSALVEQTAVPNKELLKMVKGAGFRIVGLRKMGPKVVAKHIFMQHRAFVIARV